MASEGLVFWHGGRPIKGPVQIRPGAVEDRQHGPGFYLTTSLARARKYARGGGVVQEVTLSPSTRLLESICLPLPVLEGCIRGLPRCRNRNVVINDLRSVSRVIDDTPVPASFLVNTLLFHGATGGMAGVWLAQWLTGQGIDASASAVGSGEEWVVVFNPEVVENVTPRPASTLEGAVDFPVFRAQKSALAMAPAAHGGNWEEAVPALRRHPGRGNP